MWRAELPVALRRTPPRSTNKASHDKQSLICLPWIDLCAEATGGRTAQSLGLVDSTPNTNTIPRLQQTTASSARPVRSGRPLGSWTPHPVGRVASAPFRSSNCSLPHLVKSWLSSGDPPRPLLSTATACPENPPASIDWSTNPAKVTHRLRRGPANSATRGILRNSSVISVARLEPRQAEGRVDSTPSAPLSKLQRIWINQNNAPVRQVYITRKVGKWTPPREGASANHSWTKAHTCL